MYNQLIKVILVKIACNRILCDEAILTHAAFEAYKKMLTDSELKAIQFEETEIIYKGHNVMDVYDLDDDGSHERNVFNLNNGDSVHN